MSALEERSEVAASRGVVERAPGLVLTKLHAPEVRDQVVPRERLMERLRGGSGCRLTLIASPAGSGKSTLLAAWSAVEAPSRPVAWVGVDEGDNDPVVLWLHVIEALRRACPGVGESAGRALLGSASLLDVILPRLVNDLDEQAGVVLILDDFHRLARGPARDSVAWFVDKAPSGLQLVLGSRSEPDLPLAALRAHGELLELRASDLRFSTDEAHALLNERMSLGLSPEELNLLVDRTEGWPAGLYLAGLSLARVDKHERHAFVARFGAMNRHVLEFLVGEVLEAHDPEMQTLMLRCSVLDRLCGPLCDAVLEREDGAEMLDSLARSNLFLVPLDALGEWYRFHHLFGELLRLELARREPEIVPVLHQRAAAWHREFGTTDEAIHHTLEAGEVSEAAALIGTAWPPYLDAARLASVEGWLRRIPDDVRQRDVSLLLVEAWMHAASGRRESTARAVAAIEKLGPTGDVRLADGFSSVEASLTMLKAIFSRGEVGTRLSSSLRAAELEGPASPWRPVVSWAAGCGFYFSGKFDEADSWFKESWALAQVSGRWAVGSASLAYRSYIAGDRGDLEEQRVLAAASATAVHEHGLEEIVGFGHLAVGLSLAARGQLEQAAQLVDRGVSNARNRSDPLFLAEALTRQASVLQRVNERERAAASIAEARLLLEACPDPGTTLPTRLTALEDRRRQPVSDSTQLSRRELTVLRLLSGTLSERDIARELYLSHNTIHSHAKSIYRKLAASSRTEAIEHARASGLLPATGGSTRAGRAHEARIPAG